MRRALAAAVLLCLALAAPAGTQSRFPTARFIFTPA